MLYILISLTVYAVRFFPSVYSRPLVVYPAVALLLLCLKDMEKARFLLMFLLLFSVITKALPESSLFLGVETERIKGVYGIVSSDTTQRINRKTGFYINLTAIENEESTHTGRGEVFVIAGQTDFFRGDSVFLEGSFHNGYFLAVDSLLLHRPILTSLRRCISERIRLRLSSQTGEPGLRLLLGNGDDGGYSLSAKARAAGLSHVLALSGMHLAVLGSVSELLFRSLAGKRRAFLLSSLVLVFFTWLSGWKASLLRALLFHMMAHWMETDEAFTLSFALTVLVIPSYSASLALHYALLSLSGILLLSSALGEELSRLTRIPLTITGAVSSSLSAMLVTVPLTLELFGSYSLGAILTSLPASMLITLYMSLSLFCFILPLGFIMHPLEMLIMRFFDAAALFPQCESLIPYAVLCITVVLLLVLKEAGRMIDFR